MSLGDYDEDTFTHDGKTRKVFRRGEGPAVVVLAEMPGITPKVLEFADRVVDIGCTAVLPHLFGEPGAPISVRGGLTSVGFGCVSHEFATWTTGRTSPVAVWARTSTSAAAGRASGRWGCASPAGSPWR